MMEDEKYHIKLAQKGDEKSVEKILDSHDWLIRQTVGRYMHNKDHEVIRHEARVGLFVALQDFDPSKGFAFSTYASYHIKREVFVYFDSKRKIKIPESQRKIIKNYFRVSRDYLNQNGEPPSEEQAYLLLRKEYPDMKYSGSEIKDALKWYRQSFVSSYDREITDTPLLDLLRHSEDFTGQDELEDRELSSLVTESLSEMKPRERLILELYYRDDHSLSEIKDMTGIDKNSLKRILGISLKKLRLRISQDERFEDYLEL